MVKWPHKNFKKQDYGVLELQNLKKTILDDTVRISERALAYRHSWC